LPFKLNQHRRHCMSKQKHRLMNWRAYDAGLRQRGSLIPAALSGDRYKSRFWRAAAPPTRRAYRSAQRAAGITVWFTDEAIEAWRAAPRTTLGGQPWYSPLAILTALTLRAVFCFALRQPEGLIGSVIGLLGLGLAVPDHTTLRRRGRATAWSAPRSRPAMNAERGSARSTLVT